MDAARRRTIARRSDPGRTRRRRARRPTCSARGRERRAGIGRLSNRAARAGEFRDLARRRSARSHLFPARPRRPSRAPRRDDQHSGDRRSAHRGRRHHLAKRRGRIRSRLAGRARALLFARTRAERCSQAGFDGAWRVDPRGPFERRARRRSEQPRGRLPRALSERRAHRRARNQRSGGRRRGRASSGTRTRSESRAGGSGAAPRECAGNGRVVAVARSVRARPRTPACGVFRRARAPRWCTERNARADSAR